MGGKLRHGHDTLPPLGGGGGGGESGCQQWETASAARYCEFGRSMSTAAQKQSREPCKK